MKIGLRMVFLLAGLLGLGMSAQAGAGQKETGRLAAASKKSVHKSQPQAKKSARNAKATKHAKSASTKKASKSVAGKKVRKAELRQDRLDQQLEDGKLALYSSSAYVIDQQSGKELVDKNSGVVLPIASITKLMTAMIVLDARQDMQEVITIGEEDVDTLKGTRSRLPVGTSMTRMTAMLLALMSSENRAANALGRNYPGGLPAFVAAMNLKARILGMNHTSFEEPTGLSSNNLSTARDLAVMVAAAAEYPEIRTASTTAELVLDLHGRTQNFTNTNALVKSEDWRIEVSKTGFISEAGRCLVMKAWVTSRPVVIVLLDSNGKMTRVGDANRIKRWMESAGLVRRTPEV